MEPNWLTIPVAALVPLLLSLIWYNPSLFGHTWMRGAGLSAETVGGRNKVLTLGLTYLFGLLIAMVLMPVVIHQMGVYSTLATDPSINDPQSELGRVLVDLMSKYGNNFRSFQHGVLHGVMSGIFFAVPLLGFNALYERRSFRYFAVNAGFWIVCLAIMGGIICGWK